MKKKLIAFLMLLALLLAGCEQEILPAVTEAPVAAAEGEAETLTVHFIDVGQADCALLEYGGEFMLIDGGNVEDSSLVVSYLESCGVEKLELVVGTHAHEDHIGGLGGVLAVYETGAVWSPTTTYSSTCFDNFMYYADQQGITVYIPSPGDTFTLGEVEVTVMGPVESYADTNNTSIVLMVAYGQTRFLFTGDMETDAEADMLEYWGEDYDWKVDVLKVGHHGSNTSSSYQLVYKTDPEYGVVSVGDGNSYGHPHEEILSRYSDAGVPLLRTDELGTILAVSDGSAVTLTWENTGSAPADVEAAEVRYVGNVNSKKFHLSTCASLPKEENRIYFDSYEEAIEAGYTPCGSCLS